MEDAFTPTGRVGSWTYAAVQTASAASPLVRPRPRPYKSMRGRASLRRVELEQEADSDVVDILGQPLVYDQQLAAGVLLQDLRVRPLRGGQLVALHRQVGQPDLARAAPHVAGSLGYIAGRVALTRAYASTALLSFVILRPLEISRACPPPSAFRPRPTCRHRHRSL